MNGIIERVKAQEKLGSKFGTERTESLLKRCGRPEKNLKIIHVAGTNGKGSVCEYLTRILFVEGKSVGTFTSPEVFSYNEKFRVNGEPLSDGKIARYIQIAENLASALDDKPSAFEIEVCAALLAFAEEGCEYAVIECGLGGLNDATNAICKKELAVLTSVSLEHTAVLGDTIEEICAQKAGIIKNCPVVAPTTLAEEAKSYLSKFNPIYAGHSLEIVKSDADGQAFTYGGERYEIRMRGNAQAYNAAVAIECAKYLGVSAKSIWLGLKEAYLEGRVQLIEADGKTYILDGSHNPESFTPLIQTLAMLQGKKSLVFGCLSDKDVSAAAEKLSGYFDEALLVAPDSYRAMDIKKIFNAFAPKIIKTAQAKSVAAALQAAEFSVVAVCGTFTILKEAGQWIEKRR